MSEDKNQAEKTVRRSKRQFKAEVKQVLDIVINSLYTNREIFIRELISNASDALEKMRFEALTLKSYPDKDAPYEIKIDTNKDEHTFTITDTGVGMTFEELTSNLGTIARSGTREFLDSVKESGQLNSEIIGKFGVGFYSSFMVAEEVRVYTKSFSNGAGGYEWVSTGAGDYTIIEKEDIPRGTKIVLKLKEDAIEFEDDVKVKESIKKYSNFVSFPIHVNGEKVNTVQAIWLKSTAEISDEEYKEFFNFISFAGGEEPLSRLHITSDAPIQFSALLYTPSTNPEMFGMMKLKHSVSLYCRKILIQQNTDKLLPEYLRFVTGVVDSEDLPLNISRETLQDNMIFRKLGNYLTRRILKHFSEEAKNNEEKYIKIWETFGMFLKEGAVGDYERRNDLTKLLRFKSSKSDDKYTSLDEYISRMKEGQNAIYYLNGRTKEEIENGPYMETFKKRDLEVFYLSEAIDDFVMTSLMEYEGKKLISADAADIELPEDESKENDKGEDSITSEDLKDFAAWINEILEDKVSEVRESKREMDRPAILVNPDAGMTTTMHRIMKAAGKGFSMEGKKILEINPGHPLIKTIKKLKDGKTDKGFLQSCVKQIYDSAQAEAGLLEDPKVMVERMYEIMGRALSAEETKE